LQDRPNLEGATATGPLRVMFQDCPTGRAVNKMRDQLSRYADEDITGYVARLQRKLSFAGSPGIRCLEHPSCSECPAGKDILAEQAADQYSCQLEHSRAAIDLLAATGGDRVLPNACSVGKTINNLVGNSDSGDVRSVAIEAITSTHNCTEQTSCLHCGLGRGVLSELLLDLADSGMDSPAGKLLKGTYQYLW